METVTVTLTGKNLGEVAAQAMTFAQTAQEGIKLGKTTATKKKAAAPTVIEDDFLDAETTTDETEEITLDASENDGGLEGFDDEAQEAPVKTPAKKAPKYTEKEVNMAALAHAKKHTRPKTLALLQKNFKVKSIGELKPEQYAKVIEALKV